MKQVIKIPSLGDAENTEVIEICVNPGDSVGSEDSIVVLESEKAAMDVPASKNGVVKKVLVKIGDEVKEGDAFLEIEINEEEETTLIAELNNILGWVDELKKVDTDSVEPMLSVFNESMQMREDKAESNFDNNQILNNSPESNSGFFVVPKVVE